MILVVQIVGEPATGKTTLMRGILPHLGEPGDEVTNNIGMDGRHFNFARGTTYPQTHTIVMGIYTGRKTDGTDRLGLNTQPPMVKLLSQLAHDPRYDGWRVLIEGDRCGNVAFVRSLRTVCPHIIVCLATPPDALLMRHKQREDGQTEKWLAGRRTKMSAFVEQVNPAILESVKMPDLIRNVHILRHVLNVCDCGEDVRLPVKPPAAREGTLSS